MNYRKIFRIIFILGALIASANCFAGTPPAFIQSGKFTPDLPDECFGDDEDSPRVHVVFEKPFNAPPVVTVSQQVPIPYYGVHI